MKKLNFVYVCFFLAIGFAIVSCDEEESNKNQISKNFGDKSHHFDQNCMNCHIAGGEGESSFSIAGSIFKDDLSSKAPNGVMKFFSKPNGEGNLVATLEVDDKANFYTTENIDLSKDVYAAAIGKSGKMKFMSTPLTSGSCTSCHGNTTKKLWIE